MDEESIYDWVIEATIQLLQEKLTSFEISSAELVTVYLNRIAKYDKAGPEINSIIEVNPDALFQAEALDFERKSKGSRGPLHGIPLLLKDNIDTADQMHTSAGSLVLASHYAKEDAFLVQKLREQGAIILGKTNMTEWANFIAEDMPTGYSSRGGQVLNPYGEQFIVGGSSAGSGAAIAANFATAAVGTETSGSILSPASQNALVGIKPTVGLISRSGIIPISRTQDTAGPMARTVGDAAILLNVLQGMDERDPVTKKNPLIGVNFCDYLNKDGLKGKRIGIARNPYFQYLNDTQAQIVESAIGKLRELGAVVVDPVQLSSINDELGIEVLIYEFKTGLNAYLKTVEDTLGVKTLRDVIRKNEEIGVKALKYGQAIFLESERTSGNLTEPIYINTLIQDRLLSRTGIDEVLVKHKLDAIVTPNNFGAALPAKAGYPSITVPAGFTNEGEPVGITFTSSAFCEPVLIELAYTFEHATKYRKAPAF